MPKDFGNLRSPGGLAQLNQHLVHFSYINGWMPSQDDVAVFGQLASAPDAAKFAHVARWYSHILSFSECERNSWPGEKAAAAPAAAAAAGAAPAASAAAEEDDDAGGLFGGDDEDDDAGGLFGDDDDEEDEDAAEAKRKAAEERRAAASSNKKESGGRVERSQIVLDVKPWEADTDLEELARLIKASEIPGLKWGEGHKIEPIAYGVSKLQVSCVVVDSEVPVDDVVDKIQSFEDHVQSVDIFAFNKL